MTTPSLLKKRDRAATEARLLASAEEIFSKCGFKSATTKLIATKAGANEGLIGRYFNGKDGLLFAILEKRVNESLYESLPYEPKETLEDELAAYARFRLEKYLRTICFFKIVLTQFLVDEKFNKRMRDLVPDLLNQELEKRIAKLLGRGSRKADVRRQLEAMETQIFGVVVLRVIMLGASSKEATRFLESWARDSARLITAHTP